MNRHLNIKKISLFVIMLISIFAFETKVKAKEYTCYYTHRNVELNKKNGYVFWNGEKTTKLKKNVQALIKVSFKNGEAKVSIYDYTNKKDYDGISDTTTLKGMFSLFIASDSGSQITEDDFKNGCPDHLEEVRHNDNIDNESTIDLFKANKYKYNNFTFDKSKLDKGSNQCGIHDECYVYPGILKDGDLEFSYTAYIKYSPVDDNKFNGIVKCSYANTNTYKDDYVGKKLNADIVLTMNTKTQSIVSLNDYALDNQNADLSKLDFTYNDLKGKCPSHLYATSKRYFSNISNAKVSGKSYQTYGLITKGKSSDYKKKAYKSGKIDCNTLGTTFKYIKGLYNFIRFIVPALIVVFSSIDFASVVLSGEADKLQKAKKNFIIRLIVGIAILFIPIILESLLKIAGILGSGDNLIDLACMK